MNAREYFVHEGSEEGEIVDSDEEQTMRKRIEELEAKNDELEKIATITNQFKYMSGKDIYLKDKNILNQKDVARIPSDASSISSDELEPIRKRSKQKDKRSGRDVNRKHRSKAINQQEKYNYRVHENSFKSKKHEEPSRKHSRKSLRKSNSVELVNENYLEIISLDSDEDSCPLDKSSSSEREEDDRCSYLNREELRFAVARERTVETKNTKNRLRDRLCNGNVLLERKENTIDDSETTNAFVAKPLNNKVKNLPLSTIDSLNEEEALTKEEQELRLIALRSAVLNKHWARKKRNAEVPYSPTDFNPETGNQTVVDDNMDVVDEELSQLDDIMEISPIGSPKLTFSSHNDTLVEYVSENYAADNKSSVDMDIAQSDSNDEVECIDDNRDIQQQQWCPIDIAPVTIRSPQNHENLRYPLPTHFGIYVPEMQYELPNTNNLAAFIDLISFDEEPPPPPPFYLNTNSHSSLSQKDCLEEENAVVQFGLTETEIGSDPVQNDDRESDEEASALRAVLLSKLQATKKKCPNVTNKSKRTLSNIEDAIYINEAKANKNGIESVLHKALRRLKSNFTVSKSSRAKPQDLDERSELVENDSTHIPDELSIETGGKLNNDSDKVSDSAKFSSFENKSTISPEFSGSNQQNSFPTCIEKEILDLESPKETNSSSNPEDNTSPEAKDTNQLHDNTAISLDNSLDTQATEISKIEVRNETLNNNKFLTSVQVVEKKCPTLSSATKPQVQARLPSVSAKNNSLTKTSQALLKPIHPLSNESLKGVRTTKIVRPNKVINKEVITSVKRPMAVSQASSSPPPNKIQRKLVNATSKLSSNSKEIGNEQVVPKIKVKKLVINLRASETETSDEEILNDLQVPVNNLTPLNRAKGTDAYNDIASPLELLVGTNSSSSSPFRNKNALIKEKSTVSNPKEPETPAPILSSVFEKKLDNFLKDMRKKGSQEFSLAKTVKIAPANLEKNEKSKVNSLNMGTHSAVCHLPLATQDEYRRLVHRMKLLEKQKQAKTTPENEVQSPQKSTKEESSKNLNNDSNQPRKTALVAEGVKNTKPAIRRDLQLSSLRSYEKSFQQTSENILAVLNQSLSLVAEAKKTKIAKLRYSQRLTELRAEMKKLEALYQQEERKFENMKPHLGASNQFLTTLKRKRRSLLASTTKLGKSVEGDAYSLNNKSGVEIASKSKKLDAEIKFVNSLKSENIDQVLAQLGDNCDNSENQKSGKVQKDLSSSFEKSKNEESEENAKGNHSRLQEQQESNTNPHDTSRKTLNEKASTYSQTCEKDVAADSVETAKIAEQEQEVRVQLAASLPNRGHTDSNNSEAMIESDKIERLPIYSSPLDHFRNSYGNVDFNAIVCPYEMWGKCADELCEYSHMTKGREKGTEIIIKALKYKCI